MEDIAFNQALKGIRTAIAQIRSMREAGQANKDSVTTFRDNLKAAISFFKRAVVTQHVINAHKFEAFIHRCMEAVLEIAGSLYGETETEDFHRLADTADRQPYFYAWYKLQRLTDEMTGTYYAYLGKPVFLPPGFQAIVRHEFCEQLMPVIGAFSEAGVDSELLRTLCYPFLDFQSDASRDLTLGALINLRKVKRAIVDCHYRQPHNLEEEIQALLVRFNINTLESIQYCKVQLWVMLTAADTPTAKRDVLALCERAVELITVEPHMAFEPARDDLKTEIIKTISVQATFLVKHSSGYNSNGNTPPTGEGARPIVSINIPNEHYAAYMRVKQETGFFKGNQKDIIALTGSLYLSNKDKTLGPAAHIDNFKKPNNAAVRAAWNMHLNGLHWMIQNWGEYGIPNLFDMNPHELKKFFEDLKASQRH